jgi:outer membrane protein
MKRLMIVALAAFSAALPASALDTTPVVTLQQSIDATLANGDDNRILKGNLDVARAQHALNVSKNSLSLGAAAGYAENWPFGDKVLGSVLGNPITGASGPLVGVSVAGPLTSVAANASPYIPPTTPGALPTAPGAPLTLLSLAGDTTSALGVSVSQTLWNGYPGGPTQATVDKSVLTLKGKELETASGTLALIYSVKQAYYTVLAAQRNLTLRNQILDKQNSVLRLITAIYDLKLASLADLKTAQLNARSAQVDVDSAENDLQNARAGLATLMGMPSDSRFTVADAPDPEVPVATVEEAVAAGLSQRVEIKQIELTVKSSTIDLSLARGLATPTVSVSGGVNLLHDWNANANAQVLGAAVKVSMPILDAGAVKNQVDALLRQNDVYSTQESQLQKSIATAIRSAWQGVLLTRERLEVAQLGVEATDLQYQLVSAQRDAGTASNQDLLTAAVNLANAENTLATAQSAAQLAVLQLQNVMGN